MLSEQEKRLLRGTAAEREAEARRQGIFECWETKARRDNAPKTDESGRRRCKDHRR